MGKTRVKRSKSRLNKRTRRQRGGLPKWMTSCFGGKCNNVTNPVAVATNNPMRNTQRRPTGIRRQRANNARTTSNPLWGGPAKIEKNQAEAEKNLAEAEKNLAKQKTIYNKHAAGLDGVFNSMSDNTAEAEAEAEAEWEQASAGQTQAERNAQLAEIKRRQQEAITWHNPPVATPPATKRKPVKQVAVINIGNQPHINEARRDLPAGWYADYDNNGRIGYYYQATPRSAPTPFTYTKPT